MVPPESDADRAVGPSDPYRPPAARLEDPARELTRDLASRGLRFASALLEGILAATPTLVLGIATGALLDPTANRPGGPFFLASWAVSLAVLGINLALWSRRAQSIGKAILGLRIAHRDGRPAALRRILVRQLPAFLLGIVAGLLNSVPFTLAIGVFFWVDAAVIFGPAKRCLHDYWAGTIVTVASPANDPAVVPRG